MNSKITLTNLVPNAVKHPAFIWLAMLLTLAGQTCRAADTTTASSESQPQICLLDSEDEHYKLLYSYRRAWQLVRDNTMYPERLNQWKKWEHHYDEELRNSNDLEEAIKTMLCSLGDQYTYFRNSSETEQSHKHEGANTVVAACRLPHNIAYVRIDSFSSLRTATELESALSQFSNPEGYIIDLRSNRGGYVEQALSAFELMTDEGRFVSMEGREDGQPYHEALTVQRSCVKRVLNGHTYIEARKANLCSNKPMIVLVGDDTRSAAEMLAGALRDSRKAKLVGSKTFGKGVVQSTWNLDAGCSIKIAMAHYYLPSGGDINGVGILPNVPMEFASNDASKETAPGTNLIVPDLTRLETMLPDIIQNLL